VAEVAAWLAERIARTGIPVDRTLVETAALLHDVDKAIPPDDPAAALPHGDASAEWLTRHGHPELARAVANHPVTRLGDEERYRRWSAFATREERIVAYADKRAAQHLVPMADRFAEWGRRYPALEDGGSSWDRATVARAWARAQRLEQDICRAAGIRPEDVARLRWTAAAFARAAAR
jgi:putative nucleotidyltransferase with HDIG domain